MKINKITFHTAYLDEMVVYCTPGNELKAIKDKLGEENQCDLPYFEKALLLGGYFRGETAELPEKVKAFVDIEEIEVMQ